MTDALMHPRYTEEDFKVIKEIIAPTGTPDTQIKIAIAYAMQLGLDPLRRQVMVIKTSGGYQVVVSIHAVGSLVSQHAEYRGCQSASVYPGEEISIDADGKVSHSYSPLKRAGKPHGAWATAIRQLGSTLVNFTIYLRYDDYAKETSDSWRKQPAWMIEKTARMFAMRAAFPDQIANVYAPEEFGERSVESGEVRARLTTRVPISGAASPVSMVTDAPPPLPWTKTIPEEKTKGLGECGCGAPLTRYTSPKTKLAYLQCTEALKAWEQTKDKSVFEGHHQELIREGICQESNQS